MTVPKKLYKYCPVGVNSLRAISEAEAYHASPILFNDPLDCNPTVYNDLASPQLEEIIRFVMEGATQENIDLQINMLSWGAGGWNDGEIDEEEYCKQLCNHILFLIHAELGSKGVLSLSSDWSEPLMWSHYADQHRGICIEYGTTNAAFPELKPVDYNASRTIRANDVYQWKIKGNQRAKEAVHQTYFYAKAPQWKYENEWRNVVDKAGVERSNFDVQAIYLGIRCDPVWEKAIAKMLNRDREIKLFKVLPADEKFQLNRQEVDRDKIESQGIKPPYYKMLRRLTDNGKMRSISNFPGLADRMTLKELYIKGNSNSSSVGQKDILVDSEWVAPTQGEIVARVLMETTDSLNGFKESE